MSKIPADGIAQIAADGVSGGGADAANQLNPLGITKEEFDRELEQLFAEQLLLAAQPKKTPVVPPIQGNQQTSPAAAVLTLAEVLGLNSEPIIVLDNQDAAVDPINDASSLIQLQLHEAEAAALAQKQKEEAMLAELESQLAKKMEDLDRAEKLIACSREMIDAMKAQVQLDHIRNARFDKKLLKKDQEIERLRKAIDEKDEEAKKRQSKNAAPNPTKKQLRTLITLGQLCLQNGLLDEKEAKTLEEWKLKQQREAAPVRQPKEPKGKRGRKKRAGLVMEAQNQPSLDVQESVQKDDGEEKQQQVDNATPDEASEDQVEFSLDDVTAAVEEEGASNKPGQGMEQSRMADAVLKASPVISEKIGELGEKKFTKEIDNHEMEQPAGEKLVEESKGRIVDEPKRGDNGNDEVISRRVLRQSTKASAADTNDSGRKSQLNSAKTRQLNVKKSSKKPSVPGNVKDEQRKENSDTEADSVDQSVRVLKKRGQKVDESNRGGAPSEGDRKSKNIEVKSTDADEKTCSVKPSAKRLKIEDVVENMKAAEKTDESHSSCGRMTRAMSQKKPAMQSTVKGAPGEIDYRAQSAAALESSCRNMEVRVVLNIMPEILETESHGQKVSKKMKNCDLTTKQKLGQAFNKDSEAENVGPRRSGRAQKKILSFKEDSDSDVDIKPTERSGLTVIKDDSFEKSNVAEKKTIMLSVKELFELKESMIFKPKKKLSITPIRKSLVLN